MRCTTDEQVPRNPKMHEYRIVRPHLFRLGSQKNVYQGPPLDINIVIILPLLDVGVRQY